MCSRVENRKVTLKEFISMAKGEPNPSSDAVEKLRVAEAELKKVSAELEAARNKAKRDFAEAKADRVALEKKLEEFEKARAEEKEVADVLRAEKASLSTAFEEDKKWLILEVEGQTRDACLAVNKVLAGHAVLEAEAELCRKFKAAYREADLFRIFEEGLVVDPDTELPFDVEESALPSVVFPGDAIRAEEAKKSASTSEQGKGNTGTSKAPPKS